EIIDVDIQGLDFNETGGFGAEAEWRVVTAVRTKSSKLRLLTWSWKQASGKVVKVSDGDSGEQPEPISLLRLVDAGNGRFVTVVRDDSTKKEGNPEVCKGLEGELKSLNDEKKPLQQDLEKAGPTEKPAITAQIKALNTKIAMTEAKLEKCQKD